MTCVPSFTASICVGFREGRTADPAPKMHTLDEARAVCKAYCDEAGLCVTLTPTEYIYVGGGEPGCVVGLINYPRFPSTGDEIRAKALELGERLRVALGQFKVSVVFPDDTVMLGEATN